ncbi:hypothetical protein PROFUN_13014 [Planoprotostelium fungivorum]|uniref:EGF-like domain-containing protein n=1 Tax=Planoprotostelium fungivorum TaxID=1890364 RepID=A0A2P6N5T7_9EUKA|nr:hypothetical protein PROFUN_13014 [Planoprotostelium fungivorum]
MRPLLVVLALFTFSSACDLACQNGGTCSEEVLSDSTRIPSCTCSFYYDGPTCETPWRNDPKYMILVNVYTAYTVILFFVLLCWIGYEVWKGGKQIWTRYRLVTYSICLIAFGAFLRVLLFCIDAHTIRGILPASAYQMLYSASYICWCSVLFCVAVYWMDLVETGKLSVYPHKRLYSFILLVSTYVTLIPVSIALSIYQHTTIALVLYNAVCLSIVLAFVGMTIYFGVSLRRMFGAKTSLDHLKTFLNKILRQMIAASVCFVLSAVSVVLFLALASNRWWYIAIHASLRLEEFILCACVMYIFSRKRPSGERETMRGKSYSLKIVPIATTSEKKTESTSVSVSIEEEGSNVTSQC